MKPSGHSHSHDHAAEPLSDLTSRLRQKSRRITGPRQAILDLLRQHRHPMTNKEIHAALADGGCDLATIYRSMHLLTEMGMVKRFDFGDGVARFELVTCDEHAHHHHLICTCCAEVVEIDDCFAAEHGAAAPGPCVRPRASTARRSTATTAPACVSPGPCESIDPIPMKRP
ncbi:MAG: transcriptional repressor [Acidobacteriia bacterium]|nr:transcriptional repressor [Terriglobia bacterium]